jgi:hypothetical protein
VALDIIDEAASEFKVKEEFAKVYVPSLSEQLAEMEKLLKDCDGKDPSKDTEAFDQLYAKYDEFSRSLDRLNDFWGHRVEAVEGGAE